MSIYFSAIQFIMAYIVFHLISFSFRCQFGWGYRVHRLLFCIGVRPHHECPGYDTKQSDSEASVMLELWGMWNTILLPSLEGPLWPGVVASDRVLSVDQMELNCVLMLNWIVSSGTVFWHLNCVLMSNWIVWNRIVDMYKNGFGI